MHRDPQQWAYVRRLILEEGQSRRGVSRKTGLRRNTIRKMLKSPQPPHRDITRFAHLVFCKKYPSSARFLRHEHEQAYELAKGSEVPAPMRSPGRNV